MKRLLAIFSFLACFALAASAQESRTFDLAGFAELELEGVFDVELESTARLPSAIRTWPERPRKRN